jgi:hypothetical protein
MLNPVSDIPGTITSPTAATQATVAAAAALGTPMVPSSSIPVGAPVAGNAVQVSAGAGAGGDASIVPILASQRDRYRHRNAELEEVSLIEFSSYQFWLILRL